MNNFSNGNPNIAHEKYNITQPCKIQKIRNEIYTSEVVQTLAIMVVCEECVRKRLQILGAKKPLALLCEVLVYA